MIFVIFSYLDLRILLSLIFIIPICVRIYPSIIQAMFWLYRPNILHIAGSKVEQNIIVTCLELNNISSEKLNVKKMFFPYTLKTNYSITQMLLECFAKTLTLLIAALEVDN